jgi:hypothetical protein
MTLFINRSDPKRQRADEVNDSPLYLAHENEPIDFYRKYKDIDFLPIKGGRNLQNLFDDSDARDYYWFNRARKYLRETKV